jgi:hypothetical protein
MAVMHVVLTVAAVMKTSSIVMLLGEILVSRVVFVRVFLMALYCVEV